jgi:hypothetical protein
MPYGLTWPNDPETFQTDAHAIRIILQPGGTAIPITPAGPIPLCRDLPPIYGYAQAAMLCSNDINQGAVFASARTTARGNWSCNVRAGGIPPGVLCRW